MKSLEDRLFRAVERRDSLAVDLAKGDLEREAIERYKGMVIRSRLSRVPNEAVKRNAFFLRGRVSKVPLSVYRVRQVPAWSQAPVEP